MISEAQVSQEIGQKITMSIYDICWFIIYENKYFGGKIKSQ